MDSLTETEREEIKGARFYTYPREKDETDLELALAWAKDWGAERVVLVGATGERLEHTIANTLMLAHKSLDAVAVEIWQGEQTARLIRPPGGDVPGQPGDTVSLVPLGGDAICVTTQGMRYPLKDESLIFGATRGISNIIDKQYAQITLKGGLLLMVHTPGRETQKTSVNQKRTRNVAVQVLPLVEDPIPVVDKAIEAIQRSGVRYEVGPLETTLEGDDLDRLLEVAKLAHLACFEAGAAKVVTIIKIADSLDGTTIEEKVGKYRKV